MPDFNEQQAEEKVKLLIDCFPELPAYLLHKLGNYMAGVVSSIELAEIQRASGEHGSADTNMARAKQRAHDAVNWLRELNDAASKAEDNDDANG